MRRITSLAAPGLTLLSLFMAVPSARVQGQAHNGATGPSAAPVQRWTVCWVQGNSIMTDRGARSTVYVSGVVLTVPPNDLDVGKAFGQFVTSKFLPQGLHSAAQCATELSAAAARAVAAPGGVDLDCSRFAVQCVMTDWTPAPAPNAPAAAAPPPVDPCDIVADHDLTKRPPGCGSTHVSYVVCSASDTSPTAYISATFQVTASNNAGWTSGFAQLLAQKYSYTGPIAGCANIDETAAQTYAKNRVGALRASGKTVVETGWAFGSSPVMPVVIPAAAVPHAPAPASAAPTQPSTLYAECFGGTSGANPTAYFGSPFVTTARDTAAWTKDFRAFLTSKYGSQGAAAISCNVWPSQEAAEQNAQQWRGRYSPSHKIIDTGWTFGASAPAVAVAPSPAAAESQNTSYAACWSESPARKTAYFAVPFVASGATSKWIAEYRKFLTAKYGMVGLVNCRTLQSLAEAQQQMQTWKDSARSRDQFVETGWKYE